MNQVLDWLNMGGYAWYVWPAYGLVCVFLVMNLLGLRWQKKQLRNQLMRWFKRQA